MSQFVNRPNQSERGEFPAVPDSVPHCVWLIDPDGHRLGILDEDAALTLVAMASEDPADWGEMIAFWPRYQTGVVPEYPTGLAIEPVGRESALQAIRDDDRWYVIDLVRKRFLSGPAANPIDRDSCFAMHEDPQGRQSEFVSVHLPPWWEVVEQATPDAVDAPRVEPVNIPACDREFLLGPQLRIALATRILAWWSDPEARQTIQSDQYRPLSRLTVDVHRDWLMTPRAELGGRIPRELLHGGRTWLDRVIEGQRIRCMDGSFPLVAGPVDTAGYASAPMGTEEIVIHFELCRALINAGWLWCRTQLGGPFPGREPGSTVDSAEDSLPLSLANHLAEFQRHWWDSPFEGGSSPRFIVECNRRRVPRFPNREIVGMLHREADVEPLDCDCPLCEMMANDPPGTQFVLLDGFQLDFDNEFAFSLQPTKAEWEAFQLEFGFLEDEWELEDQPAAFPSDQAV